MKKRILFVAGVYGVGKTTLCDILSEKYLISSYSSSELISKCNHEEYGKNKYVTNSNRNQEILVNQVNKIKDESFILNGHFCLKEKNNKVILLENEVFKKLNLSCILLLSASVEIIKENLFKRDKIYYDEEYIKLLLKCEEEQTEKVSNLYNIPLLKYNMQFNNNDTKNVIKLLKHIGGE